MKNLFFLFFVFYSCNEYSDSLNYKHPNCNYLKKNKEDLIYKGDLYVSSEGNLWFNDNNGLKLNLICPHLKNNIYSNYDDFINLKTKKEMKFNIVIIGHFLEKKTTFMYERNNFFVHKISYEN